MSTLREQFIWLRDGFLTMQADELRETAVKLGVNGVCTGDLSKLCVMLREAADTIDGLRDRLQDADDARYDSGFESGVKACLQQLDGLIASGYDLKAVCAWIDNQWEVDA